MNNNGPASLPYYAAQMNAPAFTTPLQPNQRHSVTPRTLYPASSLPLSGAAYSNGRTSFDNSNMKPSAVSLLPSHLNTNNQFKPTLPTTIASSFMPSSSSANSAAPYNYRTGNSTSSVPIAQDLPKRTVFSPTSLGTLGSPPDYSQNITEMMQAMKYQDNKAQLSPKLASSSSSQSLSPTSSVGVSHAIPKITQQKQEMLEKFNAKASNVVSPTHGIAGDILSSNFRHLDATTAGKTKKHCITTTRDSFSLLK